MCNCDPVANKRLSLLDESVLKLLSEVAPEKGYLSFKDAVIALHRFRINRALAMRVLMELKHKEILTASAGHGVKLIEVVGEDG